MSDIEKSKLIQLLIEQRDEARRREEAASQERVALQNCIAELIEVNSRRMEDLTDQICELTRLLKEKENTKLLGHLNAGRLSQEMSCQRA